MITVAVAGGTSPALGRSILEALKQFPEEIMPVVLSRETSRTPKWLEELGVEVRNVNYLSETSLIGALQGVHTVICTLLARDGTWASTQIRLLRACLNANVSRFAPAEFGPGPLASHRIPIFEPKLTVMEACRKAKSEHPGFEYAGFYVGVFMNYLGKGSPNEEEALHGFDDNWRDVWWHAQEMKAEIPLTKDGTVPRVTMTEIRDVGRFVAAACLLPMGSWKEDFSMVGETIPMDEVMKIAERVRGKTANVEYRSYEDVIKLKEAEGDFYRKFWYELEEMIARDTIGEGVVEPVLNELCPGVKPVAVEGYIKKYW